MHQFTGMWLNPNSRGSRLRIWQPWGCKSLHAYHLTATGFSGNSRPRRLKIAEPSGCKSRVADRRVVNREQQTGSTQDRTALGVQVSPRRPIWNVNRTSGPDLFAKQWAPRKGSVGASPRHSASLRSELRLGKPCARSSKRAGDGYFPFVKTLSPPRRFTVIWFFAASNVKTAAPSIWNLSSAVASRGTADDAPGG